MFHHAIGQYEAPVGVLLMAYGTPAEPAQVEAYYTHIRHGHPPSPALLAELQARYQADLIVAHLEQREQDHG